MPSISHFCERFIQDTGAAGADIRIRERYLRNAGLLPPSSRKADDPQAEAVHSGILLLAYAAAGPQLEIAERVKSLWSLPRRPFQTHKFASAVLALAGPPIPEVLQRPVRFEGITLGMALTAIVEAACIPDADPKEIVRAFPQIEVSHDGRFAVIRTHDDEPADIWFEAPMQPGRYDPLTALAPSTRVTTISGAIFLALAYQVMESRRRADRLGVSIPTEDAYRALGYEPPVPGHWTTFPLQPLSPRGLPARAGRPGTKNAAALAGATALRQDQEAAPDSRTIPDAMRQREKPQGQSSHGPGPPYSQRRTSHGRSDSAATSCG